MRISKVSVRRAPPCLIGAAACAGVLALLSQGCSSVPRRLAPPQAQLLSVSLLESSFEGQRFDVRLQLANPNAAALPVRQLDFDVRLGGEGILVGRYQVPFTLPPQGIETVQLEIFSDTVSSVSRLMSMAQGPENALNYEIQGEITLDAGLREPVVFYSRGRVPLTSTRE